MTQVAAPPCACGCGNPVEKSRRHPRKWNRFLNKHAAFKGGRRVNHNGYVELHRPDHPRARGNGYVFEHIVVMEAKLGRPLAPGEQVHHIDRDKANNNPDNLAATTQSEHTELHRHDKVRTGKNRICEVCGSTFYVKPSHAKARRTCSHSCAGTIGNRIRFGRAI